MTSYNLTSILSAVIRFTQKFIPAWNVGHHVGQLTWVRHV